VELLMPAKSAKQQRFMAAVANNPKFAKKVGVPQNVGEEFMMKKGYKAGGMPMVRGKDGKMVPEFAADGKGKMMAGGKVKKYQMGGMPMADEMPPMPEMAGRKKKKKKRPMDDMMAVTGTGPAAPRRMMGGGMAKKGYKSGGKVRGCGMASKGTRPAKMVSMKGS
jgi:hypothetical protein